LHGLAALQILDPGLRRDLDFYLRTQLSSKKKDSRTFTFFAQGQGTRTVRLSYTLEAPVWKATYRIILGEEGQPPLIQGWAVVDNTQDEDWENVQLSLVAGLPVSFVHDLYTPRYIRRPVVQVQETTGVLPPVVEEGIPMEAMMMEMAEESEAMEPRAGLRVPVRSRQLLAKQAPVAMDRAMASSTPAQVRQRKLGDLFEYEIEHPVTIRRNQSALVPIVLRSFEGRPVLLYNKHNRVENPMRSVELKNTTGLTLEGGPVSVQEGGSYVGEAMLDTLKPDEQRLVPYAVELSVHVLDNVESHESNVSRVIIRNRILTFFRGKEQKTTYTFHNKGEVEQLIYLEHGRSQRWELVDTPAPHEITEGYWRFRFALPAKKVTAFTIQQRIVTHYDLGLADAADNQLAFWIEQRYFDKKTEKVLGQVFALRRETAVQEERIVRLQQERETIHQEQQRIRQNLEAVGDRPAEKALRVRFVRTLNDQEDRLERISQDIKDAEKARDRCREQMAGLLEKLEYDAVVP
jgi:hypothetical protein